LKPASFWLVVAAVGVGTMLMRLVPILAHGRVPMPRFVERLLAHVPAAALATLAVPGALYMKTGADYQLAPARIIAAAVAFYVACRWRNVVLTLAVGMGALWLVQAAG
jgi:branched-subunit amino acid transport protein